MPVLLVCSCGKQLQLQDELVGKNVRCQTCQAVIAAQPGVTLPPTPAVDTLLLRCGGCGMELQTSAANRGRQVACPRCKSAVTVSPGNSPTLPPPLPVPNPPQQTLDTLHKPPPSAVQQTLATLKPSLSIPVLAAPEKRTKEAPAVPLTSASGISVPAGSTTDIPPPSSNGFAVPGYEILGELGRGGMGIVYKAKHLALKRLVALKMVLDGAHAGEAQLTRFRAEAEAVAKLQHAHIVQIYEVGECGGRPFFALEFVEGGSLDRKVKGTPLPPREAAALVEKMAQAMHAVHQQGIVHRDLKPANVLLTTDGTPKITDFGLAKDLGGESGQTASGAVMGTPSYMAPEQAAGKNKRGRPAVGRVLPRSDSVRAVGGQAAVQGRDGDGDVDAGSAG